MQIINKRLDEIFPYENNPRNNEAAVESVANSIEEFGFKVPIVVDKDGVIVAGHTRYKAAKYLGMTEVPCIVADDLNEQQINAFRLADNKVGEIATWDFSKLEFELEALSDFDMQDFGFYSEDDKESHETESGEEKPADSQDDDEGNWDSNFNYKEQYGVIVMCKDEAEQEQVYNQLTEQGFECKVVAT